MQQLQDDNSEVPCGLGRRIWRVIPKVPGADTQSQLRDLEMPNEYRKVLARGFAKILDERATATMRAYQHAFLSKRNISNANVELAEAYHKAVDQDSLRFWLLLDCSKGYNLLSWNWLKRVLMRARLPDGLLIAIENMVRHGSAVILKFLTHTCRPLCLRSGLAQGCPLSCVLYVLAVDPFLQYVGEQIAGVGSVIGFCDDWNVECATVQAVSEVQAAGEEFEQASGQRFNRMKSKILPTRVLQACEAAAVRGRWRDCPIVTVAKVLGLWIGHGFDASQLGVEIEAKYYERMRLLRMLTASWAARIVMLNVFLRSLWSYMNRHQWLPHTLRARVERRDLDFVTRILTLPADS